MNNQRFYLWISLMMLLTGSLDSCKDQPKQDMLSTTQAYLPPVFANDQRIDRIRKVAPFLHQLIEDHATARHIPGIAYGIVVDNQLVMASATGIIDTDSKRPATTTSSFRIASMTKSFTAMAIMKLKQEGRLNLEDPVEQYIPEMSNLAYLTSDAPKITIKHLLTMTAGFPEDNPWGDRQLDESDQMLLELITEGVSFSSATSSRFEYSNLGYALLGNLISRVSDTPYDQYIKENILAPLGMDHTYLEYDSVPVSNLVRGYRWEDEKWKSEPILHHGSFGSMGGLITSIEDFSKYVSFHLSAWPPRNDAETGPVSRSALREMQTPQFSRLNAKGKDFNNESCPSIQGYGYGLGITTNCHGVTRVSHGGALPGYGSSYAFFPDYGVGIMAFGNLTYTSPWPYTAIEKLLFDSVGIEPRQLPVSEALNAKKLQIVELIKGWDQELESDILAENFYLDQSRDLRKAQIEQEMEKAGAVLKVGSLKPGNQLRGGFDLETEHGAVKVFFTLTPQKNPKIQYLEVEFQEPEVIEDN